MRRERGRTWADAVGRGSKVPSPPHASDAPLRHEGADAGPELLRRLQHKLVAVVGPPDCEELPNGACRFVYHVEPCRLSVAMVRMRLLYCAAISGH